MLIIFLFRVLASQLWEQANMNFPTDLSKELLTDIEHPVECIQASAAKALGALLEKDTSQIEKMLQLLIQLYKDRLKVSNSRLLKVFGCSYFLF